MIDTFSWNAHIVGNMIIHAAALLAILLSWVSISRRLSRIERILSRSINQQPPDDGGI